MGADVRIIYDGIPSSTGPVDKNVEAIADEHIGGPELLADAVKSRNERAQVFGGEGHLQLQCIRVLEVRQRDSQQGQESSV